MSYRPIIAETVPIRDVLDLDKVRYNTNNHWTDGAPPADYSAIMEQTRTSKWIDGVDYKPYKKMSIDLKSPAAAWMLDAFSIGVHTGQFPKAYEDELDMYLEANNHYRDIFDGSQFFVRTEDVSLKGGQHGAGPYASLREVIESVTTCHFGHTPINEDTKELTLYLLPWVNIHADKEYRVFVHQGEITAISQQHLYTVASSTMAEHYQKHIRIIQSYFESFLKHHLRHVGSYAIDIAILDDGSPYFIEINPFGKEYSSGSSLYGWIQDEDILLGEKISAHVDDADEAGMNRPIYFRYTV